MGRVLLSLFLLLPLPALGQCLTDYRVNQKWQPHHLSLQQLMTAEQLAEASQPGAGWRYLARLGDPYAALAADVVQPRPYTVGESLHDYIYRHWENVIGVEKTNANFASFASQHFRQYVEILNSGTWPDADQILNSYLSAARSHGLPQLIVFDAAWTASDMSKVVSWQILNQLPWGRRTFRSRVCLRITREEGNRSLARDFGFFPSSASDLDY